MMTHLKKGIMKYLMLMSLVGICMVAHAQCSTIITDTVTPACGSLHSGTVTIHASNAAAPYLYRLGVSGTWQTDSLFSGLAAGTNVIYVQEAGGCIDSITVAIGSSGTPFTPVVTASAWTTTLCSGGGVVDTFWAAGGTSAVLTYQWYHNNAPVAGATAATYTTAALSDQDSLWVVGYTSSPCATRDSAVSNVIHISVVTTGAPSVSVSASGTSFCAGSSFMDTFTATATGAGLSYMWYRNGVATGVTTPVWRTSTLSDNDSVWVIVRSSAPCAVPAADTSSKIHISIQSAVLSPVVISAASLTYCSGTAFADTFWASTSGSSTVLTYQWYRNGTQVSGATASSWATSALSNNDSIWAVVHSSAPCASPDSVVSNVLHITIDSTVVPVATVSASALQYCTGSMFVDTFRTGVTGGGTTPAYQWYKNGTAVSGATSSTWATSALSDQDSVWVVVHSSLACAAPDSAVSTPVHISILSGSPPTVAISATASSHCTGGIFIDTFTATATGSGLTYRWYKNGVAVPGATAAVWRTSALANNDSVWVVVHSSAPCATPDSAVSSKIHITIGSLAPAVTVTAAAWTYCAGSTFIDTFRATTGGTSSVLTYTWYHNDTAVAGATSALWSTSALQDNDSVWVVVRTTTPCGNDSSVSAHIRIAVIDCGPDTVWPGDADANRIATNSDLLTIGLAYGATGPARTVQGIVWQGDTVAPWSQYFSIYAPTVNYDHADCNGDGTINADDTLAIVTNFGLTHPKTDGADGARTGVPGMFLQFSRDTVYDGQSLTAAVILGSASEQFANIYGIAFTYNYDPLVYDPASVSFGFINSWLGNYTNSISIKKTFPAPGMIRTAITGIDHLDRSGWGAIARFRGTITTDNINGVRSYVNHDYISEITAVDMKGDTIDVNTCTDSNIIMTLSTGLPDISGTRQVSIYPNPVSDYLQVSSTAPLIRTRVYDAIGSLVLDAPAADRDSQILDVSGLSSGIYTVQVATAAGTAISKVTVRH